MMILDSDIGSHADKLACKHEAVLEHVLGDDRYALRARGQQHELRLKVGGKPGMRQRLQVDGSQRRVRPR